MRRLPFVLLAAVAGAAGMLPGCASTGSTFGSGVGDRMLETPPWVAGRSVAGEALRVVHLPVAYQRGAIQPGFLAPGGEGGTPVAELLAEMNRHLDGLGVSGPVTPGTALHGTPPDVHFGCRGPASDECGEPDDRRRMLLAVGRPSASWTEALEAVLDGAEADAALLVTLEVGEYWVRQRGLRGDKVVLLGTDHTQDLPWLTSLDQPVQVLQLTGVLVGRDGRAIRAGAEGLFARRTRLLLSGFGVQELLSPEDVAHIRTLRTDDRRSDSGERRLIWETALENLVRELTR